MASSISVFGVDVNEHGVAVISLHQPVSGRCINDEEIEAYIALLKCNLDSVGDKMKAAVRAQFEPAVNAVPA
jgi:hypothetical protein